MLPIVHLSEPVFKVQVPCQPPASKERAVAARKKAVFLLRAQNWGGGIQARNKTGQNAVNLLGEPPVEIPRVEELLRSLMQGLPPGLASGAGGAAGRPGKQLPGRASRQPGQARSGRARRIRRATQGAGAHARTPGGAREARRRTRSQDAEHRAVDSSGRTPPARMQARDVRRIGPGSGHGNRTRREPRAAGAGRAASRSRSSPGRRACPSSPSSACRRPP